MKIKGPGSYSGPPAPPEPEGPGSKPATKFESGQVADAQAAQNKGRTSEVSNFEKGLQEIARNQKPGSEIPVNKIVDSVIEEVLGKDYMSKPGAANLRDAIVPLVSQDENLMNKLNGILSRLNKS